MPPLRNNNSGLTIIEIIIVVFVSSIMLTALLRFVIIGYPLSKTTYLQARSTETARLQLKRLSKAIREARQSDTGSYPLVAALPQRIIFFANVDNDAATERVRYELSGTNLVRGITEPTGNPTIYDTDTETTNTVVTYIRNSADPIFTYYTGDYPADATELSPTDLTEVKYIQFRLIIDADPAIKPPPIEIISQVQLRNLKTNLGEVIASPSPTP